MTNLTSHIRYYGIYCWLLKKYSEKIDKRSIHQYNFIRRAELALAIAMQGEDINAVIGSNFVARTEYRESDGTYNLAKGADFERNKDAVYWQYMTGAFGQYYLGSLSSLKLVEKNEEGAFCLLSRGKDLAECLEKCIDQDSQKAFLSILDDGKMKDTDINNIKAFYLNNIKQNSEEWKYYQEMMFGNSSQYRKETIRLFLKAYDEKFNVHNFVEILFDKQRKEKTANETIIGWYYYYLNETAHYSLESLFWAFLKGLEGKGYLAANPYVETYVGNIVDNLIKDFGLNDTDEFKDILELLPNNIKSQRNVLCDTNNRRNTSFYGAQSILTLFYVYKEYLENKKTIDSFESKEPLNRQFGNASEIATQYIEENLKVNIRKAVKNITQRMMRDHVAASYRKMGKSESSLLKFVIEEGQIRLIEITYPQFTSPRLSSLLNLMKDLGYIDSEEHLTELGKQYVKDNG